jgi:SET domain-containing protein
MKKPPSRRQPLFEVRHSPIHGYGVFALRRIRKGTTITEYIGDRITHDEADSRYENKAADDNHTFLFTVDARTVIDGGVGGNDARYINHGCDPNCESSTNDRRVFIEAIRTIQKGDELAYDYQIQRDPDDPPNVDEIFACRCGAAKCRGSMLEAPKKPRKKPKHKKKTHLKAKTKAKAKTDTTVKAKTRAKAKTKTKTKTKARRGRSSTRAR